MPVPSQDRNTSLGRQDMAGSCSHPCGVTKTSSSITYPPAQPAGSVQGHRGPAERCLIYVTMFGTTVVRAAVLPLLSSTVRMEFGEDAMTGQSGCPPPLCSAGREGCTLCTSLHLQPSSLLFWHVCVPPGVLVARSPRWAGWWREVHQEGSTESSLTDTARARWLLHLVWCDALNPVLVSQLTVVPSHGPCQIWILLWGWRAQIPRHHWRLKCYIQFSIYFSHKSCLTNDGFITLAHSSPPRRDL